MNNSYNNLWAKLVSLYPHKENIDLLPKPDQANQHQVDGEWKIYQSETGDTKIVCLSSSCLKVDSEWLGMNQEMRLLGGEMIAFSEEKNRVDDSFDYVFCLSNENSEKSEKSGDELKRKRDEIEESKFHLLTHKVQKFQGDINEELICAICMDVISDCATLSPCLHSFCNDCVTTFQKSSTECPTCRQKIHFANKNPLINRLIESIKSTFSNLEMSKEKVASENYDSLNESKIGKVDKGCYEGEFLDGKREGEGTMFYVDGRIYDGRWKNGKKEGEGYMIYSHGEIYEGSWKNGQEEGYGELIFPDGDTYKGNWKNGEFEEGEYTKDGDKYRGFWKNGHMVGKGKVEYMNGDVYEGDMKDIDRNGEGILTLKNGDKFLAVWIDNKIQPVVTIHQADGTRYEGEIDQESLMKNGKGALTLKGGIVLQGNWINNKLQPAVAINYGNGTEYEGEIDLKTLKRNGKGVLRVENGDVFKGDFFDDYFHGKGVYSWKDGDIYQGEFRNDQRNGWGVMKYANGDKFSGHWRNDKRAGKGSLVLANKDTLKGNWNKDLLQLPVQIDYANGDKYIGEVSKTSLKRYGNGVLTSKSGEVFDGKWKHDKLLTGAS